REAPLPVPEVARIGREIAEGLAAAHEAGLIHRDVKPGNIWLEAPLTPLPLGERGEGGRVKLLDFGLVRAAQEGGRTKTKLTEDGSVLGTPAYMAPEQAGLLPTDGGL